MTNDKSSTAQAVVDAFIKEKVEFVFGLTGSHVLPITDKLADVPQIRHIVSKHESNAAYMAGMYGYLTGRPGVVLVTAGPGATNSISGVAQAYAASLPMVHISGDVPLNAGNEAFHGVDRTDFLHRMFRDITKWSVRIERPADIPGVLTRAFALAAGGRPGPVHVDIPLDIVRATNLDIPAYQPSSASKHIPSQALMDQVRAALKAAKLPLLCAGRGVMTYAADTELLVLAESIGAPVICTEYAQGAMGGELGAGITAKLINPERQVVVVTGDGSLLMAISDMVTAVESGANILVVVLNDSRYGIISSMQHEFYDRSFGDEIGAIDFARIAEGSGAVGIRVETPQALPEALTRALESNSRSAVLLDVVCDHRYCWPDRPAILAAGKKAMGD